MTGTGVAPTAMLSTSLAIVSKCKSLRTRREGGEREGGERKGKEREGERERSERRERKE